MPKILHLKAKLACRARYDSRDSVEHWQPKLDYIITYSGLFSEAEEILVRMEFPWQRISSCLRMLLFITRLPIGRVVDPNEKAQLCWATFDDLDSEPQEWFEPH
jgi:hypothetical protein